MGYFFSIKKADQFSKVREEGLCILDRGLEIYVRNGEQPGAGLGIKVSSNIANSVQRNRIKRVIREALRGLNLKESLEILVIVKRDGLTNNKASVLEVFRQHPSVK